MTLKKNFMERRVSTPVYFLLLILLLGSIGAVLFGAAVLNVYQGGERLGAFGRVLLTVAEFPALAKRIIFDKAPPPQVINSRFPKLDGFANNGDIPTAVTTDMGYLLLSSYDHDLDQPDVQLIRIRDQKILYKWLPNPSEVLAKAKISEGRFVPKNFRIMHPFLMRDGGLLFHNVSPLLRIDACSRVKWAIGKAGQIYHHTIERSFDGTLWIPATVPSSSFESKIGLDYDDHAIANISPDGKLLFIKSVSDILDENGYRGLLAAGFSNAPVKGNDLIHLNDIQPALSNTAYWKRGDLLISVRNLSTVFLYRPSTNKILWLKTGPWANQHDVNFVGSSSISIFGNDALIASIAPNHFRYLLEGHNDIYIYNFKSHSLSTPYSDIMKAMQIKTTTEGRSAVLANGDAFIEETTEGRILRLSPEQLKWQYARKIDGQHLALLSWSRYLTEEQVGPILKILENTSCGE